jgi:uncharacterized membrane protein YkvA (DUF1232 family)
MNKTFFRSRRKAEEVAQSPRKAKKLADAVMKIAASGKYSSQISEFTVKIQSLARMLRCYAAREYIDVPWQTILLITAALVYFVSPFDAIADFIPLIGFTDDIAIISAVISSIIKDIDKFAAWEAAKTSGAENTSYTLIENQ